jgi:glycosyltransferase
MKQISIIIPHLNDARIAQAIASVRRFDDCGTVKIIVIDGGSEPALVTSIASLLTPDDLLVSEPDQGIFDALNKGLDRVDTPYMGWLGADDLFSGEVLASEVLEALQSADLFVGVLGFLRGNKVERVTVSWPSAKGLVRFGLHNGHYATFGRSELLKSERFDVSGASADMAYFLRIFDQRPRVRTTRRVATWQRLGGFSNKSPAAVLRSNQYSFQAYRSRSGLLGASIATMIKLGSKMVSRVRYLLLPRYLVGADGRHWSVVTPVETW